MYKPVHLHKNKIDRNLNVLLLLIPIVIFALTLAIIISQKQGGKYVATTESDTFVLGEETELLDNNEVMSPK